MPEQMRAVRSWPPAEQRDDVDRLIDPRFVDVTRVPQGSRRTYPQSRRRGVGRSAPRRAHVGGGIEVKSIVEVLRRRG